MPVARPDAVYTDAVRAKRFDVTRRLRAVAASLTLAAMASATLLAPVAHAGEVKVKLASLAPKDSAWEKVLRAFGGTVAKKTANRVTFQMFPGGVKGDEKVVLQRMKSGSVDAGAFLGPGAGEVLPSIRILEMPMLFRNAEEIDYVRKNLNDYFAAEFLKKGFVLLGWGEAGFVRIFSNQEVKSAKDLAGVKMWAMDGDPLAQALASAYKVQPSYLPISDVLTALQTNMINAFYAPPMGAIALQWHTKVKYMSQLELANGTGVMLMSKTTYDQIGAEDQKVLMEEAVKAGNKMIEVARAGNKLSIKALKEKNGMIEVPTQPADMAEMEATAAKVRAQFVGKLFDQALLDKVNKLLADFRAGKR